MSHKSLGLTNNNYYLLLLSINSGAIIGLALVVVVVSCCPAQNPARNLYIVPFFLERQHKVRLPSYFHKDGRGAVVLFVNSTSVYAILSYASETLI